MRRLLAALALLGACTPYPDPAPPAPVILDAGINLPEAAPETTWDVWWEPPAGSACSQACAVFEWLGCPEGTKTPNGEPCESVCNRVRAFPNFALPVACVAGARSIDAVRKCPGVRCK